MNIYLDIDGVLRGVTSPVEDVVDLLEYILANYPDSTYWLTTHCRQGYNHTRAALLNSDLPRELVERASTIIQPSDFSVLKTEAIDFNKPFLWLDDNLFESEQKVLEAHSSLINHFLMNPKDPTMAKRALALLKSLNSSTTNTTTSV